MPWNDNSKRSPRALSSPVRADRIGHRARPAGVTVVVGQHRDIEPLAVCVDDIGDRCRGRGRVLRIQRQHAHARARLRFSVAPVPMPAMARRNASHASPAIRAAAPARPWPAQRYAPPAANHPAATPLHTCAPPSGCAAAGSRNAAAGTTASASAAPRGGRAGTAPDSGCTAFAVGAAGVPRLTRRSAFAGVTRREEMMFSHPHRMAAPAWRR